MKVAAIVLARSIGFVETIDLNPYGQVFRPQLVSLIKDRFSFETFALGDPENKKNEDLRFENGYIDGITVNKLTISGDGIVVDVRSSTEDAKQIITDSLAWLSEEANVVYRPEMLKRWAYVSQLTFHSEVPLLLPNRATRNLRAKLTEWVSENHADEYSYEINALGLDFDRSIQKRPLIRFSIQRRADTNFSENKYYSEAPVSTSQHIELLQKFEEDMTNEG